MKIEHEGKEMEVFTAEDVAAREAAAIEAATKPLNESIEDLKKLNVEKTQNFKKLNEMTAEEKAAYDANALEILKRNEILEANLQETNKKLSDKEESEKASNKEKTFKHFSGGDAEARKKIEENYTRLAGMPESTPEEVAARTEAAARLSGVTINSVNPLYAPINGEPPQHKEKKEYVETPEGETAAQLVRERNGIPTPKAQQ